MDMARHMGAAAATDQLRAQIAALQAAVIARDGPAISSAELALRSAALALVGTGSVSGPDADPAMALLQEAILALRAAAEALEDDANGSRASIGRRAYMRLLPGGDQ